MKVLSIDFDYFIDADLETRNCKFPDGEELTPERVQALWQSTYEDYPELGDVEVIPDLDLLIEYLDTMKLKYPSIPMFVDDSHGGILSVIEVNSLVNSDPVIDLVNIDFHHDYYHMYMGSGGVTCANWLTRLVTNESLTVNPKWVKREDSEVTSLSGDFPFETTTDLQSVLFNGEEIIKYDLVFICFSPEWTPPHLRSVYNKLL